MTSKLKLASLVACALVVGAMQAQATTYTGSNSFDGASYNLSITTNGATGVITTGDITSWNIDITDPAGTFDLIPSNSQEDVIAPGDLTATAAALTFNFSGVNGTQLIFEHPTVGADGPFFCATSSANCFPGQSSNGSIGVSTQSPESPIEQTALSGDFVLGTSGAPVTPLPATLPLFATGLGALVLLGWFRKRKAGVSMLGAA
jgi:hypothetical protein